MALTWLFLKSLGSYLLKKAAAPGIDYTLNVVDDELRRLVEDAPPPEWEGEALSDEQKQLVAMLPSLQGDVPLVGHLRAWLHATPKRGIALLGPSGAGKSQIALRLRGKAPREDLMYTTDDDRRKLILAGRRVPLLDTPGESRHAMDGYADTLDALTGHDPPSVVLIVGAAGYLATAAPEFRSTYRRPGSVGQAVGDDTPSYLAACLEEEANYLRLLVDACRRHATSKKIDRMPRQRLRAVITVVNKRDLWGVNAAAVDAIVARYADPTSEYGQALGEFRDVFGAVDQHSHDVLPLFTHGGGFHPDASLHARALTHFHSAIDALLLRTLVSYRYTGGSQAR